MTRLSQTAAAVLIVLLSLVSCSRSSSNLRSFKEVASLADELANQGLELASVARILGSTASPEVPPDQSKWLEQLGRRAREFVQTVKPLDALKAAERLEASVPHLRERVQGSPAPEEAPILAIVGSDPLASHREFIKRVSAGGDRRESLREAFESAFDHLVYVALLIDPVARTTFAPRRSPSDLPAEIPKEPDGRPEAFLDGISTVEEWRHYVFDDQGRLRIPSPFTDAVSWSAMKAWAKRVNPELYRAARNVADEIRHGLLYP